MCYILIILIAILPLILQYCYTKKPSAPAQAFLRALLNVAHPYFVHFIIYTMVNFLNIPLEKFFYLLFFFKSSKLLKSIGTIIGSYSIIISHAFPNRVLYILFHFYLKHPIMDAIRPFSSIFTGNIFLFQTYLKAYPKIQFLFQQYILSYSS